MTSIRRATASLRDIRMRYERSEWLCILNVLVEERIGMARENDGGDKMLIRWWIAKNISASDSCYFSKP